MGATPVSLRPVLSAWRSNKKKSLKKKALEKIQNFLWIFFFKLSLKKKKKKKNFPT